MTHLDIWNTSYDQKKGRESNWQFDSWPLKVKNRPNFLVHRRRATYHWKVLDKGYNISSDFSTIRGLQSKLWAPKIIGVPTTGIPRLPLGSLETKCHLDVAPMERCREYYKVESGGFPQVWVVVSLVSLRLRMVLLVANSLWAKCEGEAHTPKSGNLESFGTPKNSEPELKGQNTSNWGVLGVIGKVLKCRCLNWPRIGHLDIFSPSYGQKKGRESNWQFDSRPLKVGNRPLADVCSGSATWRWKYLGRDTTLVQTSSQSKLRARSYERPKSRESKPGQFRDSNLGVPGKKAIWM
jgi:hypothetical protein